MLGNYDIFQTFGSGIVKLVRAGMLLCSGLIVFCNIFDVAYDFFLKFENKESVQVSKKSKLCFFFISFTVFALIDLIYLYLILFWFNITSKRDGWIETVPFIAIIISLCIATPVFAEFRYSYALYAAIPFVIFSGLYSREV